MKILNIHGYGAKAENSVFYALKNNGYEPVSLQLDYEKQRPEDILDLLLKTYQENHCEAITGSSMGGFFAIQTAVKMKCRAVLINPCLNPFQTLPELGFDNKEFVLEYIKLFSNLAELDFSQAFAIIGEKDNVVTTHPVMKYLLGEKHCVLVPEGGHPGSSLPLEEIFQKYGTLFFSK